MSELEERVALALMKCRGFGDDIAVRCMNDFERAEARAALEAVGIGAIVEVMRWMATGAHCMSIKQINRATALYEELSKAHKEISNA